MAGCDSLRLTTDQNIGCAKFKTFWLVKSTKSKITDCYHWSEISTGITKANCLSPSAFSFKIACHVRNAANASKDEVFVFM